LILAGDDDPVVPAINARVMRRLLPHATLHVYPGGHVALVTDTEQLAPVVNTFLTTQS
jgi:pimeloyl-ACP methyl ester carboxylesterase